jgi:putative PIN family toxin of toxin-antitoxin system
MQKLQQPVRKEEQEQIPDNPKVVLDTNVLVSALLSPKGRPAQILSLARKGTLVVCLNQAILDEYEDVLSRPLFIKFDVTTEERRFMLDTLKDRGLLFDVPIASTFPMPDETDRVFYDVAKTAGAFLITGNKKHFPKEATIFTPQDFTEMFAESSGKTDIPFARNYLRRHSDR